MKHLFTLCFFIIISLQVFAESEYTVFLVRGDIFTYRGGSSERIKEKDEICLEDYLIVPEGARIVLKSNLKKRHTLTIKRKCEGKLRNILKKSKKSITRKSRTREFMEYTFKKSASDFNKDGGYMEAVGSTVRDMFDWETDEKAKKAVAEILDEFQN